MTRCELATAIEQLTTDLEENADPAIIAAFAKLRAIADTLRQDTVATDFKPAGLVIRPSRIVRWNDHEVALTSAEYRILICLLAANGEVVTYRTVFDSYHTKPSLTAGNNSDFEPSARSRVKFVRKKLAEVGLADCLKNVPRQGYRWDASVAST